MSYRSIVYFILFSLSLGTAHSQGAYPADPVEQHFIDIMSAAENGAWTQARELCQQLAARHPQWKPLSLLEAFIEQEKLPQFAPPQPIDAAADEYAAASLSGELSRRWLSRQRAGTDQLPAFIISLDSHIKYVIAVDLLLSRLLLLKNSDNKVTVAADYYAGIGKQGIGKRKQGDHRTPTGIYFVTEKMPDSKLPELYGSGAMPLNYPNSRDRHHRRSGSGIWLHGVPRETYSRTPYSSRGCVTLSNAIYTTLETFVEIDRTPVVLSETIRWQSEQDRLSQQQLFSTLLKRWREDWSSLDFDRYISHYSKQFYNGRDDFTAWKARKQANHRHKQFIQIELADIAIYRYPGESDLVQIDFHQRYKSNNFSADNTKRQFWQLEDDQQWRIVYER